MSDLTQDDVLKWCKERGFALVSFDVLNRPQGKWISNHDGSWNCSECGLRVFIYAKGNFCPNCGADMRGEQDDKCRQV